MVGGPKGGWLGPLPHLLGVKVASLFGNQRTGWFVAQMKEEDLNFLSELLESGDVVPVIERTYPLEETAAALRYLGEGHAQGKNVISV
jgi:NADPH:quinone reductase-like Zn-dependent oxidoreductase